MRAEVGGGMWWQRLAATSDLTGSALAAIPRNEGQRLMGKAFQGILILIACSF